MPLIVAASEVLVLKENSLRNRVNVTYLIERIYDFN